MVSDTPRGEAAEIHQAAPNILVVEDDPTSLRVAQEFLTGAGYRVTSASNGFEACRLFRSGRFDLVLMDLRMPEMDGLEATRFIRKFETPRCDTPVVILTAFATKETESVCLKIGANGFITKPVSRDTLLSAVRGVLQNDAAADEPRTA